MPTLGAGQVAIFYSLTTGALLGKAVFVPGDPTITIQAPTGQGLLVQSSALPYDDAACYALIAANTTFTPDQHTDRCVVLDNSHNVIAVHKRDPSILPAQAGEGSLQLHRWAEVGDTLVPGQGIFHRRHARINIAKATDARGRRVGKVTGTVLGIVDATGPQLPVAASVHEIVRPALTLNVGDTIDLSEVPPGLAKALAASDAAP